MANATRSASVRRPQQHARRQGVLGTIAVLILSASLFAGYWLHAGTTSDDVTDKSHQAAQDKASALRNGVVVFQRRDGTHCGRKLIDNASGKLHGESDADCSNETGAISQPQYNPGARLNAVRASFQSRTSGK